MTRVGWVLAAALLVADTGAARGAPADGPSAPNTAAPASAGAAERGYRRDDAAVRRAMQEEVRRSMAELHLGDEPKPYYVAYALSDIQQAIASATFGAITSAYAFGGRTLRTEVRVGDPSFDNSNFEGSLSGARVESVPFDDDHAALRRELWLRTDEAYKGALESLARKRAAAAGQTDEEDAVGDFSAEKPVVRELPFTAVAADPEALRDTVAALSAVFKEFPSIVSSRVTATHSIIRRRLVSSEASWVDESKGTVRVDVVAETQADDGMKLRSFVPFAALTPAGLPPLDEMRRQVRSMATELAAMRTAPVANNATGAVLFEGLAAAQIAKLLLADHLAGTPPPKTATAGSDERSQVSAFANKLGQRVAAPLLSAFDDPLQVVGPGKEPLFGAYQIDDEGVPAERVTLVEGGVLKSLLMSRTPRKEITRSNGHARAPRFSGPKAHIGNLFVTAKKGLSRKALLAELARAARGGGVDTYVVKLLEDPLVPGLDPDDLMSIFSFTSGAQGPPPVQPLVVYRVRGGKEELVRGVTLEGLLPRSLKDITAAGDHPTVYNFLDGGQGFNGVPTSIVTPSLLISDVDLRRKTGRHRRPPGYPHPAFAPSAAPSAPAAALERRDASVRSMNSPARAASSSQE